MLNLQAGPLELSMAKMRLLRGHTEEERADPVLDIVKESECFATRSLEFRTRRGLISTSDVILCPSAILHRLSLYESTEMYLAQQPSRCVKYRVSSSYAHYLQ